MVRIRVHQMLHKRQLLPTIQRKTLPNQRRRHLHHHPLQRLRAIIPHRKLRPHHHLRPRRHQVSIQIISNKRQRRPLHIADLHLHIRMCSSSSRRKEEVPLSVGFRSCSLGPSSSGFVSSTGGTLFSNKTVPCAACGSCAAFVSAVVTLCGASAPAGVTFF